MNVLIFRHLGVHDRNLLMAELSVYDDTYDSNIVLNNMVCDVFQVQVTPQHTATVSPAALVKLKYLVRTPCANPG